MSIKNFDKKLKIGKLEFELWYNNFYPCFQFIFAKAGYFDGRPEIKISLICFTLIITLPWINEKWTDECDPPQYGISIHDSTLWIMRGGKGNMNGGNKWWTWDFPFFTKNFYKHYTLGKNGEWIDITNRKFYWDKIGCMTWNDEHKPNDEDSPAKTFYGVWTDKYDGKKIDAKYRVEIRLWRPKWLEWTKMFEMKRKEIEVCFKEEVGYKKGSWKGGVTGAGCTFKDDQETPQECFARMNEERNW